MSVEPFVPLAQLVQAEQAGPPVWTSSFHIAHRIGAIMASDGVYFAGDAAHIHSPVGARGMNLGIEDSWSSRNSSGRTVWPTTTASGGRSTCA